VFRGRVRGRSHIYAEIDLAMHRLGLGVGLKVRGRVEGVGLGAGLPLNPKHPTP